MKLKLSLWWFLFIDRRHILLSVGKHFYIWFYPWARGLSKE